VLAEREERFRNLVDLSPEPVAVHSEGRVVYANRAALALLGAASADAVLGHPIFDFVHPDYHGLVRERIHKMESVGDPAAPVLETLLRVDGSPVEAELAATPIVWRGKPAFQLVGRALAASDEPETPAAGATVDLSRLVLELAAHIERRIAPRAAVSFDLAGGSLAVRGDPARLSELVATLASQAAAALPAGCGSLRVTTGVRKLAQRDLAGFEPARDVAPGRFAMLEVAAGADLGPALRAQLFDAPFARRFPGRGPGLAGALAVARALGGALRVGSAGGLRLEACLPVAARSARPRARA
jgi:PAS domain S-box-containing protein